MKLSNQPCDSFAELLASKSATPGGGGVAALAGAFGAALSSMVVHFSMGKKKFVGKEAEHQAILERGLMLKDRLIELVDVDAENFLPLSKAYGIKAETEAQKEEKNRILQEALKQASLAPMEMVELIHEALELHERLVALSSKLIISDIGVGVQMLKAALLSAQLNVAINVNLIEDPAFVEESLLKCDRLVENGTRIADRVFTQVVEIMSN